MWKKKELKVEGFATFVCYTQGELPVTFAEWEKVAGFDKFLNGWKAWIDKNSQKELYIQELKKRLGE